MTNEELTELMNEHKQKINNMQLELMKKLMEIQTNKETNKERLNQTKLIQKLKRKYYKIVNILFR